MRQQSILIYSLLVAAFVGNSGSAFADAVEWSTSEGGNGHWYEGITITESINWFDARVEAESQSLFGVPGHLATITSLEENSFIATNGLGGDHWIGGFQPPGSPEPDGGWTWITGEPWSFTAWTPGEPNNALGNENAIEFEFNLPTGSWNDENAQTTLNSGYIVEYPIVPEPEPPTVVVLGDSGWQVSWDSSLNPFVDVAVDAVTENAVFIAKTAEFIQGKGPAGFPTIPIAFTQIEADAVEQIVINDEVITNSTGSDWTGFRYQLLNGNDAAFNPDMSNASAGGNGFFTSPFDNQVFAPDNKTFSVDGLGLGSGGGSAVIADGTQWFPGNGARDGELYIDVVTGDGSLEDPFTVFTLKEIPSFIPEPTTVSLLALGGLILLSSAIRGVKPPMVNRYSLSHAANLEVSAATKTG